MQTPIIVTKLNIEETKQQIEKEIKNYEIKYKMDSETMKRKISNSELVETDDICLWLIRLKLRKIISNLEKVIK